MSNNFEAISVVIIARNAAQTIEQCLQSVSSFSNVVLYLNESTDNTQSIAEQFAKVDIVEGYFDGFGTTKNRAASFAQNEWVLTLDSDEVLSDALIDEIATLQLVDTKVFRFKRLNHYNNKPMRCCGWENDRVVRLYHRHKTAYNEKAVHESIETQALSIQDCQHLIYHYPYREIQELIKKADHYSELFAQNTYKPSSVFKAMSHSLAMFIKSYFFKKGCLNGFEGFLISYFNAFGTALKYLKLAQRKLSCSLIITTYNRPDALELVLLSVFKQSRLPDEIIIADDGSAIDTQLMLESISKKSPVSIIHSWQEDKGFRAARSRNLAIQKSSSEYLIMIDGDMLLHKDFIKDHLSCAQSHSFIQGSRVLLNQQTTDLMIKKRHYQVASLSNQAKNKLNGYRLPVLSSFICSKKRRTHKGIRTCNFAAFKHDIERVNGFNLDFTTWGREDSELVERLFNSGIKRRNLKFKGIQYHLYHPEGKSNSHNDALLQKAIDEHLTICHNGLAQTKEE